MSQDPSSRAASATDALNYLARNKVEGWLERSAAAALVVVAEELNLEDRPVTEIGVHHGKLALLLACLTGGRLVGYDLFGRQHENIDRSGQGDRETFLRNGATYAPRAEVTAIEINSHDLTPDRIIADCGARPVLFSVDGGHTEETTFNDLALAADAMADDGIVILDDVYNEAFPAVAFGLYRFMQERPGRLTPFFIGGNKMFFASDPALAARLTERLLKEDPARYPGVYEVVPCSILSTTVCSMRSDTALAAWLKALIRRPYVRRLVDTGFGRWMARQWRLLRHG